MLQRLRFYLYDLFHKEIKFRYPYHHKPTTAHCPRCGKYFNDIYVSYYPCPEHPNV